MYIEFFMCCLTTAILQSYTVFANVQLKMFVQKREGCFKKKKEINDIVNQARWDSRGCVKEKQGATESDGGCRNPSGGLLISTPPTGQYVTLCPDMVNHYRTEKLNSPASCLCVRPNMAARGPAENGGAADLRWSSGTEERKKRKNNRENRKTGQDADICKRSDTDLEKASSSGWLMNRGVKLPCGFQSMGKILRPTDSTCTFLLLMFTACQSLEITGIFYVLLSLCIVFFTVGE